MTSSESISPQEPEPEGQQATCSWCGSVTHSLGKPHMIEVAVTLDVIGWAVHDLVCSDCHVNLVKFIVSRRRG